MLESDLRQGVLAMDLQLSGLQYSQLLSYLELLQKWNKVYNLTALRLPHEMLTHHLLDSLALIGPFLRQCALQNLDHESPLPLMDVGSGAGLPGVVIAICCPGVMVHCLDAVAKKMAFVQQVAAVLGLKNLRGVHRRVETVTTKYSVITSRAFSSLADFTSLSAHALAPHGIWMAMKGKIPQGELDALPLTVNMFHVEQLHVPGLDADRCIVWMQKRPSLV